MDKAGPEVHALEPRAPQARPIADGHGDTKHRGLMPPRSDGGHRSGCAFDIAAAYEGKGLAHAQGENPWPQHVKPTTSRRCPAP